MRWAFLVSLLWCLYFAIAGFLGTGCASAGYPGPSARAPFSRLCPGATPGLVSAPSSAIAEAATETAIMIWNEAAGTEVLRMVEAGGTIHIRALPAYLPLQADADTGGTISVRKAQQGCTESAEIVVYIREMMHPLTYLYIIRHELGHAIGLPHSWFGVMQETMPTWLPSYQYTTTRIEPEDWEELHRLYQEAGK